jgi:hypothetical protein
VRRLCCLREVSRVNGLALAVEIGDWHRFTGSHFEPSRVWCPPPTHEFDAAAHWTTSGPPTGVMWSWTDMTSGVARARPRTALSPCWPRSDVGHDGDLVGIDGRVALEVLLIEFSTSPAFGAGCLIFISLETSRAPTIVDAT